MNHAHIRRATIGAAVVVGVGAVTGLGATAAGAHSTAASTAPVIKVTVTNHAIKVSGGTTLQPGTKIFDVTGKGHSPTLQILRLHTGYSAKRLRKDIAHGPNASKVHVHAVRRLDRKVTWLGGTSTPTGATREFAVTLAAGKYFALDQNGSAFTTLRVKGTPQLGVVQTSATATGTGTDRWKTPKTLPANGWVKLRNTSSEAHFFALTKVKKHTTRKDIRKFIKSGSGGNPPWLTKPPHHMDSGVFSRNTQVDLHVHLPRGKYLLACFWPSDKSGMSHFSMGMWKLVNLK